MSVQHKKVLLQQLQEYSASLSAQKSFEKSYVISLIIKLKDEILREEMLAYTPGNLRLNKQNHSDGFLNR